MKKFVFITGLLGIPVSLAAFQIIITGPQDNHTGPMVMAALLLIFTAIALMWAAQDLNTRAPIVFWDGFVRLAYGASVAYMVPAGLAEPWEYGVVAFDGSIALIYIFGSMRYTGLSFSELMLGKTSSSELVV